MDTIVSNELYFCNSTYRPKILPFIYFYKSLLLIVGGYLAAKTRHVHISALNDSKFIVWSIYTVVLTSLFTVIVMISIQSLHTYIVLSFIVIIMTSFIICLIFLPKVSDRIVQDVHWWPIYRPWSWRIVIGRKFSRKTCTWISREPDV